MQCVCGASYHVSRRHPRDWPVNSALRDTVRTTMESTGLIYDLLIRDMPGTGSFIQLSIREDHLPKISSHLKYDSQVPGSRENRWETSCGSFTVLYPRQDHFGTQKHQGLFLRMHVIFFFFPIPLRGCGAENYSIPFRYLRRFCGAHTTCVGTWGHRNRTGKR